jgi:hypothetical protein
MQTNLNSERDLKRVYAFEVVLTIGFLAAAFLLHKGVSWLVLAMLMVLAIQPFYRPNRWTIAAQIVALVLALMSGRDRLSPTWGIACLAISAGVLLAVLFRNILVRRFGQR